MQLRPAVQQTQSIHQRLSQKMIRALRIFQMPYPQLVDAVQAEVETNVFLEVIRFDELGAPPGEKPESAESNWTKNSLSLQSFLMNQVNLLDLSELDHAIVAFLISELDDRGFLPNYASVFDTAATRFGVSARTIAAKLAIVHQLEPEGVGARNLTECLKIQLENMDLETPETIDLATTMIEDYLSDIADENWEDIAADLDISVDEVQDVVALIQTLTPNPCANFGTSNAQILVPSARIRVQDNEIFITNLEAKSGIQIGLSDAQSRLLADPSLDTQTRQFLATQYESAKFWVECLNRRRENLEKMVSLIVHYQAMFMRKGPDYLRPLTQRTIADELTISPSSVSRTVTAKAIDTPWGIFLLRAFCPRGHLGRTREQMQRYIQAIIADNPSWSDAKIAQYLKTVGLPLARRTVTKHRLASGIRYRNRPLPAAE